MKPVGKPDALIGHVRFDERGWETGRRFGVSARAHPRLYTELVPRRDRQGYFPLTPSRPLIGNYATVEEEPEYAVWERPPAGLSLLLFGSEYLTHGRDQCDRSKRLK